MPVKDPNAKNKTINGKDGIFLEKDGRSIFLYKSGQYSYTNQETNL